MDWTKLKAKFNNAKLLPTRDVLIFFLILLFLLWAYKTDTRLCREMVNDPVSYCDAGGYCENKYYGWDTAYYTDYDYVKNTGGDSYDINTTLLHTGTLKVIR